MNLNIVFATRLFNQEPKPIHKPQKFEDSTTRNKPGFVIHKTKPKMKCNIDYDKNMSFMNFLGSEDKDEVFNPYKELNNLLNEDDEDDTIMNYEQELYLFATYEVGKTYEDRFRNTYTITSRDNNKIKFERNGYLHKMKRNEDSLHRVDFLRKMQFKSGAITESIMSMS